MSALLPLRPYQLEAVEAVEAAWTRGVRRPAVVLPTGAGKGHPLDTEVPTPDGLRLWGDLKPGDRVFGSDGRPTKVSAVHDRGVLLAYRVTLKHGESVICDADHLWTVKRKGRHPRVVSTVWLLRQPLKDRDGWCWSIPVTGAVERADAALPIDPYVIGSLIANGGMTHSGTVLTTPDPEVIERVRARTEVRDLKVYSSRTCPTFSLPGLSRITRDLGMRVHSSLKRIPRIYLEASTPQRIELLQGLMAGDGSVRRDSRRSLAYSTTSPGLAEDLTELVTSLGGTCSINKADRTSSGRPVEYSANILLPPGIDAFATSRKATENRPGRMFSPRSAIISIEPVGEMPIRCITVDAEDHLYLVTRNHIVTHNTVVFAHIAQRHLVGRGGRVLVLAHRAELLDQAARRIKDVAPDLRVGAVAADLDETDADVIVGSVQTLRSAARRERLADVGLIITDECHRAVAASYRAIYDAMPGAHMLGVTATMSRGDGQALGQVWDEIVYRRGIVEMIRDGHLADVRGIRVRVPDLDLSGVKVSRGDYAEGALGTALEASLAPEVVAEAYLEHAADRKGLLFAPTVSSAQVLADALTGAGVGTEVVHGAMAGDERRAVLRRFETGATQVLSNCMVLTEGFDSPSASAAVIARPTRSAPLYVQMAGRVLRPYPGKEHALVLDVVGATAKHSLASLATLAGAPVRDGQSLTEAETEEAEREDRRARERLIHAGPVDAVEVDLFGASAFRWRQTRGGLWYIATGLRYWALIPGAEPGTYDVTWIAQRAPLDGKRGAFAQTGVSEIGMAMAWAERGASDDDLGGTISGKGRHWHRKRPSERQAAFASSLGIVITDDMRALDVSDAIDRIMASRAIDARMLPWLAAQGRDVPAPLAL